ncbi:MAG: dephospho-CoA kinase [Faecousia sp.]
MILGITGGSGCGKTTLLNQVQALGGMVLDCDEIYHRLLREDPGLLQSIEARFPGTVAEGTLLRKELGRLVFSDPPALQDLNRITHAAVKREVLRLLESRPSLAAIDAIALFEGGLAELCDLTVAVTAPREDRVLRLMVRDGIPKEYAEKRLDAQHSDAWFRERCDYVLENTGNLPDFQAKCLAFLREHCIME